MKGAKLKKQLTMEVEGRGAERASDTRVQRCSRDFQFMGQFPYWSNPCALAFRYLQVKAHCLISCIFHRRGSVACSGPDDEEACPVNEAMKGWDLLFS